MVNLKLMNVLLKHKVYKFLSRFVYMKSKGTRTERELLHMFHEAGFGGIRAAGSGSTTLPRDFDIFWPSVPKIIP